MSAQLQFVLTGDFWERHTGMDKNRDLMEQWT